MALKKATSCRCFLWLAYPAELAWLSCYLTFLIIPLNGLFPCLSLLIGYLYMTTVLLADLPVLSVPVPRGGWWFLFNNYFSLRSSFKRQTSFSRSVICSFCSAICPFCSANCTSLSASCSSLSASCSSLSASCPFCSASCSFC